MTADESSAQGPTEIDTAKIRAGTHTLGHVAALCDALDEARLEIMAHQVSDGYEKGYEHGGLVAAKYLDRAEKAEAQLLAVLGQCDDESRRAEAAESARQGALTVIRQTVDHYAPQLDAANEALVEVVKDLARERAKIARVGKVIRRFADVNLHHLPGIAGLLRKDLAKALEDES